MFAASALTKVATQSSGAVRQSVRQMSVVSGPPTVKITAAEKLIHGIAISVGILAIPGWVLVNLQSYKSHD